MKKDQDYFETLLKIFFVQYEEFKSYEQVYKTNALFETIVNDKIKSQIDGTDFYGVKLANAIRKSFIDKIVVDSSYQMSPSYNINIELDRKKIDDNTFFCTSLELYVSLLGEFYTVFLEDSFFTSKFHDENSHRPIYRYSIFYKEKNPSPIFDLQILEIQKIIFNIFPKKKYIHHQFLFENKRYNYLPYGFSKSEIGSKHSFFELLVHSSFLQQEFLVLK